MESKKNVQSYHLWTDGNTDRKKKNSNKLKTENELGQVFRVIMSRVACVQFESAVIFSLVKLQVIKALPRVTSNQEFTSLIINRPALHMLTV